MILPAMLKDAMREVLERRITPPLVLVSLTFVAACASFEFERRAPQDVYAAIVRDIRYPVDPRVRVEPSTDPKLELAVCRPLLPEEVISPRQAGGHHLEIRVHGAEALTERVRAMVQPGREPTLEDHAIYIRDRFLRRGIDDPTVYWGEEDGVFFVKVSPPADWSEVSRAYRITALFGGMELDTPLSLAHFLVRLQMTIGVLIAGAFGVLIGIVVTAGSVPSMLARAAVDLLLVKPIGRGRLLLYKYLGGLLFVLLHATVLIGGTWAALAWRSGWWNPGYLGCILVVTAFFAVLHAVAVLVGVVSRSAVAPILATLGTWIFCFFLGVWHELSDGELLGALPDPMTRLLKGLYVVLPKAFDVVRVSTWFIMRGRSPVGILAQDLEMDRHLDFTVVLGSSGAFVAIVLALACWVFSRRDY